MAEDASLSGSTGGRNWYVLWPMLACVLPLAFYGLAIIASLFLGGGQAIGAGTIVEITVALLGIAIFILALPVFCFMAYEIYFKWLSVRVNEGTLSAKSAAIRLAVVAFFIGVLALLPRGALPIHWFAILEGPIAFGLVPAVVAAVRITRIKDPSSERIPQVIPEIET